jgi:hypothetical protein
MINNLKFLGALQIEVKQFQDGVVLSTWALKQYGEREIIHGMLHDCILLEWESLQGIVHARTCFKNSIKYHK